MILSGSKSYAVKVSQSAEDIFSLLDNRIRTYKENETAVIRFLSFISENNIDYSKVVIDQNVIILKFPSYSNGRIVISLFKHGSQNTLLHCVLKPRLKFLYILSLLLFLFFTGAIIISTFIFHSHVWLIVTTGLSMAGGILLQVNYTFYQLKSYLFDFLTDLKIKPELQKLKNFTDNTVRDEILKI